MSPSFVACIRRVGTQKSFAKCWEVRCAGRWLTDFRIAGAEACTGRNCHNEPKQRRCNCHNETQKLLARCLPSSRTSLLFASVVTAGDAKDVRSRRSHEHRSDAECRLSDTILQRCRLPGHLGCSTANEPLLLCTSGTVEWRVLSAG